MMISVGTAEKCIKMKETLNKFLKEATFKKWLIDFLKPHTKKFN